MLLRDQAGANAGAEMLVQEACHRLRRDVFPTLEEATGEDGDGVGVSLNEVGHDFCELGLLVERGDLTFMVGEKGREGVQVVGVYARDVRIGYDDKGQVS